jgi:hypothetical protein
VLLLLHSRVPCPIRLSGTSCAAPVMAHHARCWSLAASTDGGTAGRRSTTLEHRLLILSREEKSCVYVAVASESSQAVHTTPKSKKDGSGPF